MCANIKLDEENRKVLSRKFKRMLSTEQPFCLLWLCYQLCPSYLPRLYRAGCKLSHQQKIFNSIVDSSDRLGVEPLAITQREQDLILTTNIQHIKICDITIQNYSRDIYNIKNFYNIKKIVEKVTSIEKWNKDKIC